MIEIIEQIKQTCNNINTKLSHSNPKILFDENDLQEWCNNIIREYKAIDNKEKLSDVYKNFILNALNKNQKDYITFQQNLEQVSNLSDRLLVAHSNEIDNLNANITNKKNELISHLKKLNNLLDYLKIQKKIVEITKYSGKNIVILGKNGSGKTSLAKKLESINTSQYLLIPAVRILELKEESIIQNDGNISSIEDFKINFNINISNKNITFNHYPFMSILGILREDYRDNHNNNSKLIILQNIWSELFPERSIDISKQKFYITNKNHDQKINTLSDGEKMALFIISMTLIAKPNSYIIIDEPENNINIAILNELYNKVEQLRPDCIFIYITHSLDLATGRLDAKKYWMKSYNHKTFEPDFEEIQNDDEIPEELFIELMGHKKPFLFCEGAKSSLDFKLFSVLFKNYSVIPVGNCDEVIKTLSAVLKCKQLNVSNQSCAIIDRDFRDIAELNILKEKKIYHFDFYKIENLLCAPEILEFVLTKWDKQDRIENGKNKLCDKFKNNYAILKDNFEKSKLQYKIKNIINSKETTTKIKQNVKDCLDEELESSFPEASTNYKNILQFYSFKDFIPYDDQDKALTLGSRIIKVISENVDLQSTIINKYFSEIPKIKSRI